LELFALVVVHIRTLALSLRNKLFHVSNKFFSNLFSSSCPISNYSLEHLDGEMRGRLDIPISLYIIPWLDYDILNGQY
jgi:hypothetical protein